MSDPVADPSPPGSAAPPACAEARRNRRGTLFDPIKQFLAVYLGPPATMHGLTVSGYWRLLRENRFRVDPPFWVRGMSTLLWSLLNSAVGSVERRVHEARLGDVTVEPPVFVLGFYRSGTTHLHNLLCVDQRFAYPDYFQTLFPATFLTTEALLPAVINLGIPERRPMDNMHCNVRSPNEDEFALCALTGMSPLMSWVFPQRAGHYDRYLTFQDVPDEDTQRWNAAMRLFVKKLTWKYRRPLVLKSPPHTARIGMLLKLFPRARFVHIHRHPFDVFRSAKHMIQKATSPYLRLQMPLQDLDERILKLYADTYHAFFEQQSLIPPGQFSELAFEQLESDPIGQLRRVYQELDLPNFRMVEPALQGYVASMRSYRKNRYSALPGMLRKRIAHRWQASFKRWDYRTGAWPRPQSAAQRRAG